MVTMFTKLYHEHAFRFLVSFSCFLLVLMPLGACSSDPLQLTPLDIGIPAQAMRSPVVGTVPDNQTLHVRITFKIDPNLLKQAQNQPIQPGHPSHLEQFAQKIGIDDATYQKIKNFFNAGGIKMNLSKLRTHLSIEAHAGTLAHVLQTRFLIHKYNSQTFFAPDANKPPQVPKFLADSIDAVTGLDNYSAPPVHQLTMNFQQPATQQRSAQDCYPQDQTLLPKEIAHAYGFDQLWNRGWHGENMTINLVEIDGAYKDDIQNYFSCIQFKGKLSVVNVSGKPQEALGESTLDIQMVAGLARSSNIVVYQTDASDSNSDIWALVNDELQRLLDDNVNNANAGNVVSISLGTAEGEMTGADMRAIDSSIRQLTQVEHMGVFIASGDCGAFTSQVYGQLSVSFPASDPWAIAVGGTVLQIDQNSNRYNEQAWSDNSNRSQCRNSWGSGGGNSADFKRPSWQNAPGVNNSYSRGQRQLPDVSAVAYALAVYYKGQWGAVGGTSAAAPIWATGMALVNEGLLQQIHKFDGSPQTFYRAATTSNGQQPYYDVRQGNNLYYPATAGWDYATGLGTPNLPAFYQAVYANLK
ncbi:MAG TPA: S53 family peptidase [Ktedonobacteraceae bacterium]|nr:S53 family peptidase [Ktedonobacteraceae bacterium]